MLADVEFRNAALMNCGGAPGIAGALWDIGNEVLISKINQAIKVNTAEEQVEVKKKKRFIPLLKKKKTFGMTEDKREEGFKIISDCITDKTIQQAKDVETFCSCVQ